MSILDDAIREHLELKRAHGADTTELKKLEDEAFGPPARPDELDPLAEAPTEFLATEGGEGALGAEEMGGRRVPNIADLQEAPEPRKEEPSEPADGEVVETIAEESEPAEATHSTGERHAIAEQPTEHFDVEAEIESGGEASSPSDEDLLDAEAAEPRLPVDPPAGVEPASAEAEVAEEPVAEEEEEDDFFSEQRLSDELSQALDAPIAEEHEIPEAEEVGEIEEEEYEEEGVEQEEPEEEPRPAASEHEDVLEDTPDFLEDTPEDDDLWFEQRPPKDFDFDD
jgi:hypothetical protein